MEAHSVQESGPRRGVIGLSTKPIRLDSNENPYGAGPAAMDAIRGVWNDLGRYPDEPEESLAALLARWHGIAPECILMG